MCSLWSGLSYDFPFAPGPCRPGTGVGPALAVVAIAALGWRIATAERHEALTVIAVAIAPFAAQTIAVGGIERLPGDAATCIPA